MVVLFILLVLVGATFLPNKEC
ncbi:YjcZ family sporulation protein [Solibacillus sp. A46]|uniref:YjcZ family sporulation protein n=1 Tax=Solibacillus faecavium TaxID=2762221 RepID=A0ABR8XW45_9BACL|nr:YjcZ family sporulation protein [Solibacillus faecavium]